MFAAILPVLGSIGSTIAKNLFPDPADELKRAQLETEFKSQLLAQSGAIENAAAEIITTEAASQHWLAANWRPLTMLIFVGLIVSRWLGYAAEGMTEAEYLEVYGLIKIGLGGYVVGRSAEKILPGIVSAMKK